MVSTALEEKYEKKYKEARAKYDEVLAAYKAKYEQPFKNVTYTGLLRKQWWSKNKFANLIEGNKAFS